MISILDKIHYLIIYHILLILIPLEFLKKLNFLIIILNFLLDFILCLKLGSINIIFYFYMKKYKFFFIFSMYFFIYFINNFFSLFTMVQTFLLLFIIYLINKKI
jgi:hypothetical protein